MRKYFYCFVLCIFAASARAGINDGLYTKQFATCMDKSGGVTSEMLKCITVETKTQDARLNGAYNKLMKELKPDRKKQLLEVQKAWIRYRDLNCRFYEDPEGGTSAIVNSSDCFLFATASRAKELENLSE